MGHDVEFPDRSEHGRKTITSGFFEREIRLSGDETATFLRNLADAVESGTSITVSGSDWEIPFEYREPIEVEVEFSKKREGELEIEVEFAEAHDTEGSGLSVE
ncbi:amphi-Trp domain-containing protein [Halalkalicoccus jeotgali]|uniref:Amphi-Trp domain-containing protein n=1 Tax=Halalkalicoccus jeotgali (strain DSM 18796 / CECT 7217 / JCM 14584 / KCTC 4019 / B3) TaxID=795797 RepID=D8J9C9_HALJB|nr:amphi-Trp domain-containing protein [Halalkalicoccus jeotgali]ADJ14341.1 hypothetical protein HacjB3_04750 [Halalkalicoccus jeotgali B3]ELY40604.1 hypothetical protein C497_03117 [Halalkalicoccus jeotgali B3]